MAAKSSDDQASVLRAVPSALKTELIEPTTEMRTRSRLLNNLPLLAAGDDEAFDLAQSIYFDYADTWGTSHMLDGSPLPCRAQSFGRAESLADEYIGFTQLVNDLLGFESSLSCHH